MNSVIACIDGSTLSGAVCDAAIWAAKRLDHSLLLLHTLEKQVQQGVEDFTGAIGLGVQTTLLEEMARIDEQKAKLALQHGKSLLDAAFAHAQQQSVKQVEQTQRHGDFVDALVELGQEARMAVVGRSGEAHQGQFRAIGSHIESLIRRFTSPVMIISQNFTPPQSFLLAYDGRASADAAIERIISGGLLSQLTCHLVMIKNNVPAHEDKLLQAEQKLRAAGVEVVSTLLEGEIFQSLRDYQRDHDIGVVVMGAFGHSKLRYFFLGSNTMRMIEAVSVPLIILKS